LTVKPLVFPVHASVKLLAGQSVSLKKSIHDHRLGDDLSFILVQVKSVAG